MLIKFVIRTRRYNLEQVSPLFARVNEILESEPSPQNYEDLLDILELNKKEIPQFCENIRDEILMYMCNFIALGEHE